MGTEPFGKLTTQNRSNIGKTDSYLNSPKRNSGNKEAQKKEFINYLLKTGRISEGMVENLNSLPLESIQYTYSKEFGDFNNQNASQNDEALISSNNKAQSTEADDVTTQDAQNALDDAEKEISESTPTLDDVEKELEGSEKVFTDEDGKIIKTKNISEDEIDEYNSLYKMKDDIYKDEDVLDAIDTDGDGKITDEEKEKFESFVKGDKDKLDIDDLKEACKQIKEGKFDKDALKNYEMPDKVEKEDETQEADKASSAGGTGGAGGCGGSGGGGNIPPSSTPTDDTAKRANLDNMSLNELKAEKTTADADVNNAKEALSNIASGNDKDGILEAAQTNVDNALNDYKDEVAKFDTDERKYSEELEGKEKAITEQEKAVDQAEAAVYEQEMVISEAQATKDSAESYHSEALNKKNTAKAQYDGAKQTAEVARSNATQARAAADSARAAADSAGEDDENKESLESAAEAAEAAAAAAEAAATAAEETAQVMLANYEAACEIEADAQAQLDAAQEALTAAEDEKQALDDAVTAESATLAEKEMEKDELEYEISQLEGYEESKISELKDSYDNAKADYKDKKADLTSKAKETLSDKQNYVNDINSHITKIENEEKVGNAVFNAYDKNGLIAKGKSKEENAKMLNEAMKYITEDQKASIKSVNQLINKVCEKIPGFKESAISARNEFLGMSSYLAELFKNNLNMKAEWIKGKDGEMSFLAVCPEGTDPDEEKPLMIVLHGADEFGDMESAIKNMGMVKVMIGGEEKTMSGEELAKWNGYILFPQAQHDHWTFSSNGEPDKMSQVANVLDRFSQNHNFDKNNISIVGLSAGGAGALYFADNFNDYQSTYKLTSCTTFGSTPYQNLSGIDIPVHAFYGEGDDPYFGQTLANSSNKNIDCTWLRSQNCHLDQTSFKALSTNGVPQWMQNIYNDLNRTYST